MTTIVSRCGELVADEINISAGTAEIGRLTVAGGPEIVEISSDTTMSADSDSVISTVSAVDAYIADRDTAGLAAAKKYTDDRTGNSYYDATFTSDTDLITIRGDTSGEMTLRWYGWSDLELVSDEPIVMNSAITIPFFITTNTNIRNEVGNYRWISESLDPHPVAGIVGPQIKRVVDWATYMFLPEIESTYFATTMIPFVADRNDPPTELRLYMRYSMSGASTVPVTFRSKYQLLTTDDIIGPGEQRDTIITPSGIANGMTVARLAMPDILTTSMLGAQLALSFARIGQNSPNPDNMFVWDISLVFNHAFFAVNRDDI